MSYFIIALSVVLPWAIGAALYWKYGVAFYWTYLCSIIYYAVAYHVIDRAFRYFGTGHYTFGWPNLRNRTVANLLIPNGDHGSCNSSKDGHSTSVRSNDSNASPSDVGNSGERTEYDIKVDFNTLAEMARKLNVCEFSLYFAHYRTTGEIRSLSKSRKTRWCGRCLGCAIFDRAGKTGART